MKITSTSKVNLFCGILFALVGFLFVLISVFLAGNLDGLQVHSRGNVEALPKIFALMGTLELLIAFALFFSLYKKAATRRKLLRSGEYVTAEITGFPIDYRIRVNRRPTYGIECAYRDPDTGIVHIFKGGNFLYDPSSYVLQRTVRVYVDKKSGYAPYFVDTDSILPEIKRHG